MKRIDYQFVALLTCAVLGWSLGEVLSLTWPQFEYITCQLCRIQYNRAKNEVLFGAAAVLGDKTREALLKSAGDFFFDDEAPVLDFTPEQLAAAEVRMDKILAEQEKQEAENV